MGNTIASEQNVYKGEAKRWMPGTSINEIGDTPTKISINGKEIFYNLMRKRSSEQRKNL